MRARVLRPRGVRKASRVNDALRCCLPPWGTASALRSKRLSRLNGRPARAPVNAPAMPLRTPQYDSGSVWFAIPSPYGSLIHYSSPAYRRFPPTLRRGRRMGRPCRSGDVNAMIWCFAIASALLVLNLCFLLRRVRHKVLLVLSVVVVGAPGAIVVGTRERRVGQLAYEFPSNWEDLLVQSLGFTVPALVLCLAVCAVLVGTVPSSHREESESPTCLVCGYSLCGLPTPRCPECGTPFDPVLLGNREKT